ncbi:MAG: hypothetical protein IJX82_08755 [Clostridia bacterium]|nr:hypothetical protein [Clostridia bacterium]
MDLKSKTISILGDSISTYTDVSNGAAADHTNSTIRNNVLYYTPGTWGVYLEDTWWHKAFSRLGLTLLVNNSWSGSCLLNPRFGTVGAYADRCVQLHNDYTGEEPENIAIFMGTNDYSHFGATLGTAEEIDYSALITETPEGTAYKEPITSCEAYAIILDKIRKRYPHAKVYCLSLLPRKEGNPEGLPQPVSFNQSLASINARFGCTTVDLYSHGISPAEEEFNTYFADSRVHPGVKGMAFIAGRFEQAFVQEK